MKQRGFHLAVLFLSLTCICGVCSKDSGDGSDNNTDINPVLSPNDTWVTFNEETGLVLFHGASSRPATLKWMATKINTASLLKTSDSVSHLGWSFENTGKTMFSISSNEGGKEKMSIDLVVPNGPPAIGTYLMDIDYKKGFCWYYVLNSSGANYDSVRHQEFTESTFNITKVEFVQSVGTAVDEYRISGDANFRIMYFPTGASSTTDIHSITCVFNKVLVDYYKL